MIEELWQDWDGSNWRNLRLYTNTYVGNDNVIERLGQDWDGSNWVDAKKFTFTYTPMTGIEQLLIVGNSYIISNNYPNPFNPTTTIKYPLPKSEKVKIEIFNLLGQKISTLLNKQMPAGSHEVEFTAKDLPSGVYLYRIEAGEFHETKKMILIK